DLYTTPNLIHDHHRKPPTSFEGLTKAAGGEPFTTANPVFAVNVIEPAVNLITAAKGDPQLLIAFARVIEETLGGTYQSFVPQYSAPKWRGGPLSGGGTRGRPAAPPPHRLPPAHATPREAGPGAAHPAPDP